MTGGRPGGRIRATVVAAVAVLLAATALHAVLSGSRWLVPVVGAVATVAVTGAVTRRLRVPVLLGPVLALVALLVVATATYAGAHAFLHVLPTWRSLGDLRRLAGYGFDDMQTFAAPVYPRNDLVLLAFAGVGLVALAVDLLAVTGERPSLAGFPLVLLLAVPAAVRSGGIGIWPFLLAGAGYLGLLALDAGDRAGRWGRSLAGPPSGSLAAEAGGSATGWRIGAVTLGVALLVPLAIPGAHGNPFASGQGDGTGGSSSTTVVNPLVQVAASLTQGDRQELLTVQTTAPTYQRLTALESFTDGTFSLLPLSENSKARIKGRVLPVDPPAAGIDGLGVTETLHAAPNLAEPFLPVPEGVRQVQVPGDWRLSPQSGTIFSSRTNTRDANWTVEAQVPQPTAEQLRAAGPVGATPGAYPGSLAVDLQVPSTLPTLLPETARRWVEQAHAVTAYDAVASIQDRLAGPEFHYDLKAVTRPGVQGFTDFLEQRRGYCQQFAATMAAMVRTLGIPARVAIGFTPGTLGGDGRYHITNRDAHAWPEVWFPTAGWVRFEPTPLDDGRALVPSYAPNGQQGTVVGNAPPSATVTAVPTPSPSHSGGALGDKSSKLDSQAGSRGGGAAAVARGAHSGRVVAIAVGILAGVVVLVLLLCAPVLARGRAARRRLRTGDAAALVQGAWAQLLEDAADRGVLVPASASPRTAGRLVGRGLARAADHADADSALQRLVADVERVRYAPAAAAAADEARAAELRRAVAQVRRGLSAALPPGQRLRVLLAPPSGVRRVLSPLRTTSAGIGQLLDAAVGAVTRAGRLLGGRRAPAG